MYLFITGSHFYDQDGFGWEKMETEHGDTEFLRGFIFEKEVIILPRHGKNHKNLPNHINYLANFAAIQKLNPECVISFSVCGALNGEISLAHPVVPHDFFFPENRLPDGNICTMFQKGSEKKGHLIPTTNLIDPSLQCDMREICAESFDSVSSGVYVHANGPRFNSPTEIQYFQSVGGDIISQTCGPEIVLCNELQIPFGMLCFTIDYANGVSNTPTSPAELGENLKKSTAVFKNVIEKLVQKKSEYMFQNFVFEV